MRQRVPARLIPKIEALGFKLHWQGHAIAWYRTGRDDGWAIRFDGYADFPWALYGPLEVLRFKTQKKLFLGLIAAKLEHGF